MLRSGAPDAAAGLLQHRVVALIRRIKAGTRSAQAIEPELRGRVGTRLTTALRLREIETRELLGAIETGTAPVDPWTELYRLQLACDELFEETLSLLEGAALRAARLDDGYCGIADALLDEIGELTPVAWDSFTVLGTEEIYVRSTRVISVRFPSRSFWDLPVVVHEYGHFAGPAVTVDGGARTVHPLEDQLQRTRRARSDAHWPWLHEVFADAFATYVLGPAYGLACALDRFDPAAARDGTPTHPPPNLRIAAIVAVLDRQNPDRRYDHVLHTLRTAWSGATAEAGTSEPAALTDPYGSWLDDCMTFLTGHLAEARYGTGWWSAQELAHGLGGDEYGEAPHLVPGPAAGHRMRDIVNAGWLARIGTTDDRARREIERQARELAEFSMAREVP